MADTFHKWRGSETVEKAREYYHGWKDAKEPIPSIAGLACYLETSRQTIYNWQEEGHQEKDDDKIAFAHIVELILTRQQQELENNGLTGAFNSTITKVMLTKHGYRDEHKFTGGFNINMPDDDADTL